MCSMCVYNAAQTEKSKEHYILFGFHIFNSLQRGVQMSGMSVFPSMVGQGPVHRYILILVAV